MVNVLYRMFRGLSALLFRVIFRTRIAGRERVPATGGLLLVSNHISFVDPPLLAAVLPRPIHFLTMVEIFRHPVLAKLARGIGCIPVDRAKVDHSAAREAIRRLRAGHCIGIFPEGGIRLTNESVLGGRPILRTGLETIAVLGQAVVLPVIVRDTRKPYRWQNWFCRPTMSVTFGQPFCLWRPAHQRDDAALHAVVRDELLKTVALD
ncbi:MAG: 1-acyl-sn-glycerol-3-phosphate acyltransferase [Verrucomicrobiae bacterium]|nr:1-acyl-sn-glycerol-3-phosphate acyltransferase [Verrucomicrobiae bacterium]